MGLYECNPETTEKDIQNMLENHYLRIRVDEIFKLPIDGGWMIHVDDSKIDEYIEDMDGFELRGKNIELTYGFRKVDGVYPTQPNHKFIKLVVFNLPDKCSEKILQKRFQCFCEVVEVAIHKNKRGHKTAFIRINATAVNRIRAYFKKHPLYGEIKNMCLCHKECAELGLKWEIDPDTKKEGTYFVDTESEAGKKFDVD